MMDDAERRITRKAMAFDLCNLFDEHETYTKDEIKEMIRAYLKTADQK